MTDKRTGGSPRTASLQPQAPQPGRNLAPLDFTQLNEDALMHLPEILEDHLGLVIKTVGKRIQMLNPLRPDDDFGSFSIDCETGVWADFAGGDEDKGGDVTSLVAYIKKTKTQGQAGRLLRGYLDQVEPEAMNRHDVAQPSVHSIQQSERPAIRPAPTFIEQKDEVASNETGPVNVSVLNQGEDLPRPWVYMPGFGKPKNTYWYRDPSGKPISVVHRFENAFGKKSFCPSTLIRNSGGTLEWINKAPSIPRPLYNLDLLTAKPAAQVVICEGEKAADAAVNLLPDSVATTTMNGAQSPQKSDFSALANRQVVIWPDHDAPGEAYADQVVRLIEEMAPGATVTILNPVVYSPDFDDAGKPILLTGFEPTKGWDAADAFKAGWTPAHMQLLLAKPDAVRHLGLGTPMPASGDQATAPVPPPARASGIPSDYAVNDTGVYYLKPDQEGGVTRIHLSSRIDVVALARSADSSSWGTQIKFLDRDGKAREWCIPNQMFGSERSSIIGTLLSMGAWVVAADGPRVQLVDYIQKCAPETRALAATKAGWNGRAFVLPDSSAYGAGSDRIEFLSYSPSVGHAFSPSGSLDEWKDQIAALCAGNSRLALAICTALAGPALHLLNEENGGFHFRGESSIGKTTALLLACSVWGAPSGFMKRWRATANGLESTAALHNDMVLPLDEIGQVSPVEAGEVAYMLGNGQGKARANSHGGARPLVTWRLMILSTGESSLADHMASAGKRVKAGQEARLVDIPADPGAGMGLFEDLHGFPSGADLARAIKERCDRSCGVAGRAFVQYLAEAENQAALVDKLKANIAEFEHANVEVDASGQVKRVGHRFALVAAVGELCVEVGVLPWQPGEATAAAKKCFDAYLESRGGSHALEATQAIDQVRRHLQMHGESHFVDMGHAGMSSYPVRERHGFRRQLPDQRWEYFIECDAFSSIVCMGLDARAVTKALVVGGYLIRGADGKNQVSKNFPGVGQARAYHISADLLGSPPTHDPATPRLFAASSDDVLQPAAKYIV